MQFVEHVFRRKIKINKMLLVRPLVGNIAFYHMQICPFSNSGLVAGRDRSASVIVRFN